MNEVHLYIHFPFCPYRCFYCDFNVTTQWKDPSIFKFYCNALLGELSLRQGLHGRLGSIYMGGGTPSLIPGSLIRDLLQRLRSRYEFDDDIEITLESNPGTVTLEYLQEIKEAGVSRLSIGVQSLLDRYLAPMGRYHTVWDSHRVLEYAKQVGFQSLSVDLIYGFPGQTIQEWERDLKEIIKWNLPHISCYAFSVEEGTRYHRMVNEGKAQAPAEDLQAEMILLTEVLMESAGYTRYEISNFGHRHFESRHNLNYWNYGNFIGLGAGAVSFFHSPIAPQYLEGIESSDLFGLRTTNIKKFKNYIAAIDRLMSEGVTPWYEREPISPLTAAGEFMMMGLRLKEGVSAKRFEALFGDSLTDRFGPTLKHLWDKAWIEFNDNDKISLTRDGRLFASSVSELFLP